MKEVEYKGVKFFVKERYYHKNLLDRFTNNTYEKDEEVLVNQYYNNTDSVLEIGACLGYVTSLLSNKCKEVISVEANPELIEGLLEMKKNNNLINVQFVNTYISNSDTNIKFQTYDNIVAGSGDREDLKINNVRGWGHTLKEYDVTCTKLTEIENVESVNAMVIDCEGGELTLLNNNSQFIKDNINKITIELHQHLMKDGNFNNKCIKIITDVGLKLIKQSGNTYHFQK